jgi:hypothetical protein
VAQIVSGLTRVKIDKKLTVLELLESNFEKHYDLLKKEKMPFKTALALFFMDCGWPVAFYIVYFYCSGILRDKFHYTAAEIIQHNLFVGIVNCAERFILSYLAYKIYPLKILKFKWVIYTIAILFLPYILTIATSPIHILLIQMIVIAFGSTSLPSQPIIYKYIPIFKRFTYASFSYAFSTALIYIITSYGLISVTKFFGYWGLLVIAIPGLILYIYGVSYFEKLEKKHSIL